MKGVVTTRYYNIEYHDHHIEVYYAEIKEFYIVLDDMEPEPEILDFKFLWRRNFNHDNRLQMMQFAALKSILPKYYVQHYKRWYNKPEPMRAFWAMVDEVNGTKFKLEYLYSKRVDKRDFLPF